MKPTAEQTGTNFTPATTEHSDNKNGAPGLPLMSPEGQKLASKTAPASALQDPLQDKGK